MLSATYGSSQSGLREPGSGYGSRAIELGLQQCGLRVEHFRVGCDAGVFTVADDAARFCGGANAVNGCCDGGQARLELERALAHFGLATWRSKSATRASAARAFADASGLIRFRAPAVQSAHDALTDTSQESCQSPLRGKKRVLGRA